jgi:predicted Zn-dependent protease
MRKLLTLFVALLAVFTAGGCITDPVTGDYVVGAPISEAEEAQMGLSYKPQIILEMGGPYPDQQLQDYLGGIVLPMAKRSVRPDLPWSFTVVNTSVPNAFAVPGGQVFVTRGILTRMEDEAEFAVVMGHELGHVEHRHSVRQQGWTMISQGAVAVVGSQFGEGAAQGAGMLAQVGILLPHSRDDERESDVRGIENSYAAGYDPREGADVFREFLKMKQEAGDTTPNWLSTHPADEERIQNILTLSAEKDSRLGGTAPVDGLRRTTPQWQQMLAKLRSEQKVYDRYDAAMNNIAQAKGAKEAVTAATQEFAACEKALPGHAIFAATLGKALLITGDGAGGRAALDRASRMNQGLLEPEWLLGLLALKANDFNAANAHAERGLAILPGNYPCLFVRGESNWNLGRKDQAQADLQAVIESAPQESEEYQRAAARLSGGGGSSAAPAEPAPKAAAPKKARR